MKFAVPSLLSMLFLAVAVVRPASGQPSIQQVTGVLKHGETVSVRGEGFDHKRDTHPLKWDDFQSVPVGQEIVTSTAAGPEWTNNGGSPGNNINPVASTRYLRPNTPFTRHMESQWRQPAGGGDAASNVALVGQKFAKMFVDAWLYNDTVAMKPASSCCNFKHLRLHQDGAAGDKPNLGLTDAGPFIEQFFGTAGDNRAEPHSNGSDYATSAEIYNRWVHLQWMLDPNAAAGPQKGRSRVYINGALRVSNDADNLVSRGYTGWTELYLGNYVRTGDYTGSVYAYWDSVMVDNGWNRVELSNDGNYASATHREIQPWSSWADDRVSFVVNRGSFLPGENVYVCVVDDNDRGTCEGPHVIDEDPAPVPPPAAQPVKRPPGTASEPQAASTISTWGAGIAVTVGGGVAGGLAALKLTRSPHGRRAHGSSRPKRNTLP